PLPKSSAPDLGLSSSSSSSRVAEMLNLLPWRRRIRLPRAKKDLVALSDLSGRVARSSCGGSGADQSAEAMEEGGRRDEEVELVVLLLERALKTESLLGAGA